MYLKIWLLIILISSGSLCGGSERPNLLLFLVDDMGIGDTSLPMFYRQGNIEPTASNQLYRTPNMEQLARQGRLFTNAYAYSVCSPTRISLMTGQSAIRHRVTTWTHPKSSDIDTGLVETNGIKSPPNWRITGIDRSVPLLPNLLRDAGYRTLFAGKAHFGPDDTPAGDPINLGFDVNIAGFGDHGACSELCRFWDTCWSDLFPSLAQVAPRA